MKRFLILVALMAWTAGAQPDVKLTRDLRENPDYVSFSQWCMEHLEMATLDRGPEVIYCSSSEFYAQDNGLIALVVDEDLADGLGSRLNRMIADIESRGYVLEMSTYTSAGTAEYLRNFLAGKLDDGLVGAILVGDLPAAWYQMNDDWNSNGQFDSGEEWYEEFPSDLFLSDLDGVWSDDSMKNPLGEGSLLPGPDGIYDSHTGDRVPEIWVSRIDASGITYMEETDIYNDYFDRVHSYRQQELILPSRGLFFIDQDWSGGFEDEKMDLICDEYDEVRDTTITDVDHYKEYFSSDGLYLTVCVHSSPQAHYFHKANQENSDMLWNWEINYLQPQYGFYNLFACSNCRWVEPNCVGSLYSFTGNGLASLGTSKTGSMLIFSEFNTKLAEGQTWGEAFKYWETFWIENHGNEGWANAWFMGMCLLGDGALDLGEQVPVAIKETRSVERVVLDIDPFVRNAADIKLSISEDAHGEIAVWDAAGRKIETLYQGTLPAGNHYYSWDGAAYPAGIYFVKLNAGHQSATGKIVKTK